MGGNAAGAPSPASYADRMTGTAREAGVRTPAGVPAARQTLALLQALARQPGPVPAAALARDLGLPRSTTYALLAEEWHGRPS